MFSAGLLVLLLSGCQTDPVVGRKRVRGPLTAFESVEIARQSNMSLAEKSEVDLVEQLLYHRTMYSQTLEQLRNFYQEKGYAEKRHWAETEMTDLRRVRPYHYLLDSEIPRLDLVPERSIPQADQLYDQALAKAKEAGMGLPALYNRAKMSDALNMFKQVIREYPESDKIDDAAFYCRELYKEYFDGEESIAVEWYELAWTWDPATPHPARFQAAVVFDYRLHDREKALELYRAAVAAESNRSNRRWAMERIRQLTEVGPVESRRTDPIVPPDQTLGQAEPGAYQPNSSGGSD
jgi:tetratricopeptide (TPR) repeat protein